MDVLRVHHSLGNQRYLGLGEYIDFRITELGHLEIQTIDPATGFRKLLSYYAKWIYLEVEEDGKE